MLTVDQINAIREALAAVNGNREQAAQLLGISTRTMYRRLDELPTLDTDIITEAVRSEKNLQRARDSNRLKNKAFREHARIENAVESYAYNITKILTDYKFAKGVPKTKRKLKKTSPHVGVVHWSDQHLNERVNLPHNTYDWTIASKRLRKHVVEAIGYFKYKGIKSIIVAMSGDLMNSDRRLDELMANAGNRSKASVLAVDLYQQALLELAEHFHVTVVGVCGNESRMTKDIGWDPEVVTDSYDFTIHELLRLFLQKTNIEFVPITDPNAAIVNVLGYNLLVIHGHATSIKKEKQLSVQSLIGRYSARGTIIHMVIWGHLHEASIADNYARSSSLVGPNDYSESNLGLTGRASQNLYVIHGTGGFDGLKVDLQNTDDVTGYDINNRLECYHTKSAEKCHEGEVIFKVII